MIQLSLRTEARGEAYILSRKLTAESDRMSDALTRSLISVEDARNWLSHVITEELARIRRVDLVTRMDPLGRAEEDARADWATATAWELMAEFGPRAGLGQPVVDRLVGDGANDADVAALEHCLDLLTRDMLSEARMNRIASDFRGLTGGKRRPEAVELLQLRRWLIEGLAAAWAQRGVLAAAEAEIAPGAGGTTGGRDRFGAAAGLVRQTGGGVRRSDARLWRSHRRS